MAMIDAGGRLLRGEKSMTNDQLYFYNRGFNDCLAKGLNPVKELTDEEITDLFRASSDHIEFARAILRKAQE
jgi:hypothetical protein